MYGKILGYFYLMILFGTCEICFQKFKKKSPKIEETKRVPYDSIMFPPNYK